MPSFGKISPLKFKLFGQGSSLKHHPLKSLKMFKPSAFVATNFKPVAIGLIANPAIKATLFAKDGSVKIATVLTTPLSKTLTTIKGQLSGQVPPYLPETNKTTVDLPASANIYLGGDLLPETSKIQASLASDSIEPGQSNTYQPLEIAFNNIGRAFINIKYLHAPAPAHRQDSIKLLTDSPTKDLWKSYKKMAYELLPLIENMLQTFNKINGTKLVEIFTNIIKFLTEITTTVKKAEKEISALSKKMSITANDGSEGKQLIGTFKGIELSRTERNEINELLQKSLELIDEALTNSDNILNSLKNTIKLFQTEKNSSEPKPKKATKVIKQPTPEPKKPEKEEPAAQKKNGGNANKSRNTRLDPSVETYRALYEKISNMPAFKKLTGTTHDIFTRLRKKATKDATSQTIINRFLPMLVNYGIGKDGLSDNNLVSAIETALPLMKPGYQDIITDKAHKITLGSIDNIPKEFSYSGTNLKKLQETHDSLMKAISSILEIDQSLRNIREQTVKLQETEVSPRRELAVIISAYLSYLPKPQREELSIFVKEILIDTYINHLFSEK